MISFPFSEVTYEAIARLFACSVQELSVTTCEVKTFTPTSSTETMLLQKEQGVYYVLFNVLCETSSLKVNVELPNGGKISFVGQNSVISSVNAPNAIVCASVGVSSSNSTSDGYVHYLKISRL